MSEKTSTAIVGRKDETERLNTALKAKKNVLLEGPVGVGKTHLALAVTKKLGRPVYRIDGDSRYTEQKLSGWFDPPTVLKKGFTSDAFFPGPLVEAMRSGGVLFINELNRLPEGVQNILLPAIDERMILVPRLGEIKAKTGFQVIATQNPKEFVATSHLSEAMLDRFELVVIDYQPEDEEIAIVAQGNQVDKKTATAAVKLVRMTRDHPRVRRGASVRAAQSIADLTVVFMAGGKDFAEAFLAAVLMALPTRIEIEREADSENSHQQEIEALIREWVDQALSELKNGSGESPKQKKK